MERVGPGVPEPPPRPLGALTTATPNFAFGSSPLSVSVSDGVSCEAGNETAGRGAGKNGEGETETGDGVRDRDGMGWGGDETAGEQGGDGKRNGTERGQGWEIKGGEEGMRIGTELG